ncbi:hypothetical protein [Thiomicrorhabdus sp.]|uniref:hypothetical protein n=1 Tax=Thiomicrorhabdus sp. TaxID=2039724 RepID=UPI0035666C27
MRKIGFKAHGFIIFDFVPENELQTGIQLYNNLRDFINIESSDLFCEKYRCQNKTDFLQILNKLKQRVKEKKEIPYIHIEGHSTKKELKLLDNSRIEWSEIFGHFREINILAQNNLFFSSGACEAAHSFKSSSIKKACPIFGLLAPEKKVSAGEAIDGFIEFFRSLISSDSLSDALNNFSNSTDSQKFSLIFSSEIFKSAACNYIRENCMGQGRNKRLERLLTEAKEKKPDEPIRKLRKALKKELYGPQALHLKKLHDTFLIIDIFPNNAQRFIFHAVKFEKAVRDGNIKCLPQKS